MHTVSIICASPPLLKPTPIRPVCRRAIEAQAAVEPPLPPLYSRRNVPSENRPTFLRASTLDGRSLEEVIQAARQASSTERNRSNFQKQVIQPQAYPTYQSAQSRPRQLPERRESWHSVSTDRSSSHSRSDPRRYSDEGGPQAFTHYYYQEIRQKRLDTPFGPRTG